MSSAVSDQPNHGTPQRFGATNRWVAAQSSKRLSEEFNRWLRLYRPVRDKQGTSAGVEEARARPDNVSAFAVSPDAVLQADRITQSASSFRLATSEAVK